MKRSKAHFRIAVVIMAMLILTAFPLHMQGVTIKVGTIAPLRSPWIKELKKLGLEWKKISNGQVVLKIYPGGTAGSEEDMVRKIRTGILGGAVFTNRGINILYPDAYVLAIPFYLESDAELDYIMEKMRPTFEKAIEEKNFKVIAWSKAGWVHFFTKKPVITPDDLKKHKLSFTTGAPAMEQAWKKAGLHVIPNELKDLMMGLQSGMVNAFYLPPLMAASGQYFPKAPNMCSLKVAPVLGGFVLSNRIWNRIPEKYRDDIVKVTREMADRLYEETKKLEQEAIDTMKKHKLVIHQVPQEKKTEWKDMAEESIQELVGKAFSKEIYDQMLRHLKDFRNHEQNKTVGTH